MNIQQQQQVSQQLAAHRHASHVVDLDIASLRLPHFFVQRGVFRPQGMASMLLAAFLAERPFYLRGCDVLDMGCGTGLQGIVAGLCGARSVTFSDISPMAILNARRNAFQYGLRMRSHFICADLFPSGLARQQVIVFNHPFFPARPPANDSIARGMLDDGILLRRFLQESPRYLQREGIILMPFYHLAGVRNDPGVQAPKYGYMVRRLVHRRVTDGLQKGRISLYLLYCSRSHLG